MELLKMNEVRVDPLDKNGMTPLQSACFRGDINLVRHLIDMGADVNANWHDSRYSALMFAALNGLSAYHISKMQCEC